MHVVISLTTLMLFMTTFHGSSCAGRVRVLINRIHHQHHHSHNKAIIQNLIILFALLNQNPIPDTLAPSPLPLLRPGSRTRIRLDLLHHIRIRLIRLGPIVMINLGADTDV